jgi:type IV pilus assembly protein PilA
MPRRTLTDDRGFTLVEILVVVLMLGILAMIALPSFLGQRDKGQDTEAQTMVRTAMVALRTYETDHNTFDVEREDLETIEPAIGDATAHFDVEGDETEFTITERSASGTEFTITRADDGKITRTCDDPGHGLCDATADADGNRW